MSRNKRYSDEYIPKSAQMRFVTFIFFTVRIEWTNLKWVRSSVCFSECIFQFPRPCWSKNPAAHLFAACFIKSFPANLRFYWSWIIDLTTNAYSGLSRSQLFVVLDWITCTQLDTMLGHLGDVWPLTCLANSVLWSHSCCVRIPLLFRRTFVFVSPTSNLIARRQVNSSTCRIWIFISLSKFHTVSLVKSSGSYADSNVRLCNCVQKILSTFEIIETDEMYPFNIRSTTIFSHPPYVSVSDEIVTWFV